MIHYRSALAVVLTLTILGPASATYAFDFNAFDQARASTTTQTVSTTYTSSTNPLAGVDSVLNDIVNSQLNGTFQSSLPTQTSWTDLTPVIALKSTPAPVPTTVYIPVFTPVTPPPTLQLAPAAPIYITTPPTIPAFNFTQPTSTQTNVVVNASPVININQAAAPAPAAYQPIFNITYAPPAQQVVQPQPQQPPFSWAAFSRPPQIDPGVVVFHEEKKQPVKVTYTTPKLPNTGRAAVACTTIAATDPTLTPVPASSEQVTKDITNVKKMIQEVKDAQDKANTTNFILLIIIGVIALFTFIRTFFIKNN